MRCDVLPLVDGLLARPDPMPLTALKLLAALLDVHPSWAHAVSKSVSKLDFCFGYSGCDTKCVLAG